MRNKLELVDSRVSCLRVSGFCTTRLIFPLPELNEEQITLPRFILCNLKIKLKMALMTEERRKEMEEEMSRFELEIATPEIKTTASNSKPLSPPPGPPPVSVLIPEVLAAAAPPPPPPPLSPPIRSVLHPPPPPPMTQQRLPMTAGSIRFIPHQLQRVPPRPPQMRQSFMPVGGPPMGGPPSHYPHHFGPPMNQGHSMGGPPMPGHPMPPVGAMHPMSMQMQPPQIPPPMGGMNVSLPVPPGFGPPSASPMGQGMNMPCEPQQFMSNNMTQNFNPTVSSVSDENASIVASAPAIYAAPFMKTQPEIFSESITSSNGQEHSVNTTVASTTYRTEKQTVKSSEESYFSPATTTPITGEETVVTKKKEKKKKTFRMAGGQTWEDSSLMEWENDDFRIFCGDLGNDVTDEVLIRAFSKYTSFVKAKVIRDKRTNKTKGYGFVSFKDPQDFIKAMREMNGRYVGSRPIKLRKSTWRDRNIDVVKKKQREKEKLGLL